MGKNPTNLAIILDGNRRYAKKAGIPKLRGHEKGYNKIRDLLEWCMELGIKEVTLYCFSTENFNRSKEEVNYLFNLFRKRIGDFKKDKLIHENKVKISIVGRISMFPDDMQESIKEVMEATKDYENYKLNLAMAYGSKTEIIDAIKKIINKNIKNIDEKVVKENLYLADDVDILIRPGGEKRMSNFLLWQAAYSELIFLDTLWPEFTKEDLIWCIEEYKRRERRFGE
ncbi:di-trans,poly-cis-decaprenylcistransferase [Candidatus Woesearchaeota archaeon]|nr:di-trans,poly-cis-decaprenylcistransferase [Candidatus Woesearchaeota archaeon]|tara:strand:- start:1722 stop:2402 length:681 start_codon:yes stop_codon:yes gene_type:complete